MSLDDFDQWVSFMKAKTASLCGLFEGQALANTENDIPKYRAIMIHLIRDIEEALEEDKKYNLSPEFENVHREWISYLNSHKKTAEIGLKCSENLIKGVTNVEQEIAKAVQLMNEGNEHLNTVFKLITSS